MSGHRNNWPRHRTGWCIYTPCTHIHTQRRTNTHQATRTPTQTHRHTQAVVTHCAAIAAHTCKNTRTQRIRLIKRRRTSSLKQRKETCTVPMNLHGVGRSRRSTFKWAPKVHHMMGKTQKGHCERSFGTNAVLVLAINAKTFSRRPNLLKRTLTKNVIIEQVPN